MGTASNSQDKFVGAIVSAKRKRALLGRNAQRKLYEGRFWAVFGRWKPICADFYLRALLLPLATMLGHRRLLHLT